MNRRIDDERPACGARSGATAFAPARHESRSERVREIRFRIGADVYRSDEVVEVIARRILMSREL